MEVVIVGGSFVAGALMLVLNRLLLNLLWPVLTHLRKRAFVSVIIVLACILVSMALSFGALMGLTNLGQLYYPVPGVAFLLGLFTRMGIRRMGGFSKLI